MQKKTWMVVATAVALLALASVVMLTLVTRSRESSRQLMTALETERSARVQQEDRARQLEADHQRVARQNEELANVANNLRQSGARQGSNVTALLSRLTNTAPARPGQPESSADPAPVRNAMGEMMDKMMKDPAMRDMIRGQQKGVMNQMYGSLFKDLQLTPEQRQQFVDILLDNAMKGVTQAGSVFQGDSQEKSAAIKAIADEQKDMSSRLKSLLGDDKFARYEEYQKTIGERTQLGMFRQQLEGGASPLGDAQMAQLMDIMRQEKDRVPPVFGDSPGQSVEMLQAVAQEEQMNKHFQWQEDLNRRVLERAGQVLTLDQTKEYGSFLQQQLEMQKLGLKMAREMFGGAKDGPGIVPAIQPVPVPAK